jgi:hypothetical protein
MLFRCQLLPGSRVLPLHVTVTLNQFAKLGFIYSSIATKSCTGVNACRGVPYRWGMGRKPLESPEAPCLQDGVPTTWARRSACRHSIARKLPDRSTRRTLKSSPPS